MKLTSFSDYSIRVLVYLSINNHKLVQIQEMADAYGISKNHLTKIIYQLGKMGYIETIRGRNGGNRLAKAPAEINIGELVRRTEEDFYIVECFSNNHNSCPIAPVCSLRGIFNQALNSFFSVLDAYTLADITSNSMELQTYLRKPAIEAERIE
ncbi:RrF2 family transcriptional regulator [Bacillus testis]|uniref:RrF2 family transcriptional regulator n=1 Tax=Bacillus testis TaxID=1622072 RepID=UPI00067EEC66|nr:Rrf2 family transcriptional regulator [Bacillus testis]